MPLVERRRQWEELRHALPNPEGVEIRLAWRGGVPVEVHSPETRDPAHAAILYLHGGAYVMGSARTHRHLIAAIARVTGHEVTAPDYRLAPEHPFPAAVEDALAVYEAMLTTGISASRLFIAGDSAGGGLALAVLLMAQERGLPMPAGVWCLSPWTDLTFSNLAPGQFRHQDIILSLNDLAEAAASYLQGADPAHPLASPVYGDLAHMPPLLIQTGTAEVLMDDALGFARAAGVAGASVTLQLWPDMPHVWHALLGHLDEAENALISGADWLQVQLI